MLLTPETTLDLGDGKPRVRLSYVFQDDDGRSTGVTSRWLLSGIVGAQNTESSVSNRPEVYAGNWKLGKVDPSPGEDAIAFAMREPSRPTTLGAGALTCTFALPETAQIGLSFDPDRAIEPIESLPERDAHVLGEGPVGKILEGLDYLRLNEKNVYPLLRLGRSSSDRDATRGIRNGAMVTTASGGLVGVIVALSTDRQVYSVAPIQDVLYWHRLHWGDRRSATLPEEHEVELPPRESVDWPADLDPRYKQLLVA